MYKSQSGDPICLPDVVVLSWGKADVDMGYSVIICYYSHSLHYLLLDAILSSELEPSWVWKYFSTAPADIDMEPTSYPNNPINEPSHRIWFRFKFINSDWNGSWIGCLCFDYNRSLTKSITIDCNGVRSSIMIMKERRARVESWDREYAEAAANVRNISPCWCWKPHPLTRWQYRHRIAFHACIIKCTRSIYALLSTSSPSPSQKT